MGGDEGNEGDEGHEGHEEEEREQDRHWQARQGHGAPWLQGEDRRWLAGEGPHQEQARPCCEQEAERQGHASPWIAAVKKARAALKIKGFCAIKKGTPLYAKAKEFFKA